VLFTQVGENGKRMVRCVSREGRERWAVPLSSDPPDFPWAPFAVTDLVVIARAGALWACDETGEARWAADRTGVHAQPDGAAPTSGDRVELVGDALRIDRDRAFVALSWYDGSGMMEIDGQGPAIRQVAERRPLRLPLAALPVADGNYRLAGFRGQVANSGSPEAAPSSELPDGGPGRRFAGTCPLCGAERTYLDDEPRHRRGSPAEPGDDMG
jgi:hypothetical protein